MIKELSADDLHDVHGGSFWSTLGDIVEDINPVVAVVKILSFDWLNPAKVGEQDPSPSNDGVDGTQSDLHGGFDNPANGGLVPVVDTSHTYPDSGPVIYPS